MLWTQTYSLRVGPTSALLLSLSLSLLGLTGCQAMIGSPGVSLSDDDEADAPFVPAPDSRLVAGGGLRRLSVRELEQTLDALFPALVSTRGRFAPEVPGLFDTEIEAARIGTAFSDAALVVADSTVDAALQDETVRAQVLHCDESDVSACLSEFVNTWPVRIIQRDLSVEEKTEFLALLHADLGAAEDVVGAALAALLVHPEFLFRVSVGEGTDPIRSLIQRELLSELSFLLWGQAPDEALRDAASTFDLREPTKRRELAETMMDDPRGARQRSAFHAQWLGYMELDDSDLGADLWAESNALVERATAANADYHSLLLSTETWLTPSLAEHYGLPEPSDPDGAWVDYGSVPRRGILSHGSFLSTNRSQGQASPTKRGKAVMGRLLCTEIDLPDELDINTDAAPGPDECREDFLREVHAAGSCEGCHSLLDGIGFGLEIFGATGAELLHEPDKPHCGLDGAGALSGAPFVGGSGLAEQLVEDERLDACMVQQIVRFQLGTDPSRSPPGENLVDGLLVNYQASGRSYRELMLSMIESPEFAEVYLP